jgi:putative ABC transport system permease protein
MSDCLKFAWFNLRRGDRLRVLVAVAGAGVAIFVVLLHLAFLRAVQDKASQVYDLFNADVVLVSNRFQFLYNMPEFPRARLRQAGSHPAVVDVGAVSIGSSHWLAPETETVSSLMLIGLDLEPSFLRDAALRAELPKLGKARRILMDRHSDPDVGRLEVGLVGHIRGQPATVAGLYRLGLPMYAAATVMVSRPDYSLFTGRDPQHIQLGLVQLKQGSNAATVAADLNAGLPHDVRAMTAQALRTQEQDYFVEVKPLGVMMRFGLLVGLSVGAVALFQALGSQMETRLRDFAVLRAMGFASRFIYGVGALQLLLLGGLAFVLAWLTAIPVFAVIARLTHLSLPPDGHLLLSAGLLCLPMIATAALPVLRAGRADPASLF